MSEKNAKNKKKSSSKKPTQLARNKSEWLNLCAWLELNIFEYSSKQKLQKAACGVLDGLRKGQCVANKNQAMNGEYPLEVILMTFQIHKDKILYAVKNKEFDSELSKMRYVCAIARNYLNDVYSRYLNAKKTQEKAENLDTSIIDHEGAEYQSSTINKKTNSKFEELW